MLDIMLELWLDILLEYVSVVTLRDTLVGIVDLTVRFVFITASEIRIFAVLVVNCIIYVWLFIWFYAAFFFENLQLKTKYILWITYHAITVLFND